MDMHQRLRKYLAENFLYSGNGASLDDNASLLEAGIIDSTGVLELILFLEETFQLDIPDEDIVPDNFDSINRIASYVASNMENGLPTADSN